MKKKKFTFSIGDLVDIKDDKNLHLSIIAGLVVALITVSLDLISLSQSGDPLKHIYGGGLIVILLLLYIVWSSYIQTTKEGDAVDKAKEKYEKKKNEKKKKH